MTIAFLEFTAEKNIQGSAISALYDAVNTFVGDMATQTSTDTLKHITLVISIAKHVLTLAHLVSRGKIHLF